MRGTSDLDTRAVQVADDAACLNSGDCFVLRLHPKATKAIGRVFAWEGAGASDDERQCAKTIAEILALDVDLTPEDVEVIAEGEEPAEFWKAIGGKKEYAKFSSSEREAPPPQDPRLFQICDAAAGGLGVHCEEIFNFCQDDLVDEDVMLLDVVSEVYLWIGSQANENEKREASALAAKYVEACAATDGRDVDTPVTTVAAGAEPRMFTCHFIGWDDSSKAGGGKAFVDPYEAKLAAARAANPPDEDATAKSPAFFERPKLKKTPEKNNKSPTKGINSTVNGNGNGGGAAAKSMNGSSSSAADAPWVAPAAAMNVKVGAPSPASGVAAEVTHPPGSKVVPYTELQTMDAASGLEMTQKESYLTDTEFKAVFGLDKEEFGKLALWKKQAAKKKVGLF